MGALDFQHEQPGIDVEAAFAAAVADACHQHGHRGYTGTIAEKNGYIVVQATPIPYEQAVELASQLGARADTPFTKRGPAGAIPITGGNRVHRVELPRVPGGYADFDTAATEAVADLLTEGEQIVYGVTGSYQQGARGRVRSGVALVPTRGAMVHTGWLFFGSSPY